VHEDSTQHRHAAVLYLVLSGAPAPEGIPQLVTMCQAAGWRVAVFSTPDGTRFIDPAELEQLTGEPVCSEYRMPGMGKAAPPADAVLACPLTFNSVNKFAHGHADNFAVSLLCEMLGYGVPVVVVPHCKPQLASHVAFNASLGTLGGMGVRVLFDPDAPYERRLPPWRDVISALPIMTAAGERHGS
jgi:phosphopantothenoylcysteine synthetase/decarboxylase